MRKFLKRRILSDKFNNWLAIIFGVTWSIGMVLVTVLGAMHKL